MRSLLSFAAAACASASGDVFSTLSGLKFLNQGTVRASDTGSLNLLSQCNGFSEDVAAWTTFGPTRQYLYNTSNFTDPSSATAPPAPPMGMRSAVPLGGFGAGIFEVRTDGSFADWMIEGQGTALARDAARSSKVPLKDEAFLGVHVSTSDGGAAFASSLRTAPPPGVPAVEALTYSGAYPFSRHVVTDAALPATVALSLFSYGVLDITSSLGSSIPAAVFVLTIKNSAPAAAANVSLMMSLPLGAGKDTDRPLDAGDPRNQTLAARVVASAAACAEACAGEPNCTWWSYTGQGIPGVPPVEYNNSDCPGSDLPDDTRRAVATFDECTALCATVPGCGGVVWDTIGPEQQQQCGNSAPGVFCCLPKSSCLNIQPKTGDFAWSAGSPAVPAHTCALRSLAPAVEQYFPPNASAPFADGVRSGVRGAWAPVASAASAGLAGLSHVRAGAWDADPAALWQDPAAATADYTLLAADADAAVSFGAGDTPADVWAQFAAGGGGFALRNGSGGSVPASWAWAPHGAIATSAVVPAGGTRTLALVFSWHQSHRLYVGQDLGNFYATRYAGSLQSAVEVATQLGSKTAASAALNGVLVGSSLPGWLADWLQAALSLQSRMTVWVANNVTGGPQTGGRYRTFEAYSNCDAEPVHVSSYHLLPYVSMWPDLLANVLQTGWAARQQADGMVQEFLGNFGAPGGRLTGELDLSAGGRTMGDTTTVFILATLGVWQAAGDKAFLAAIYPAVAAAAVWQMDRADSGGGFPPHLQTTYDYLGLDNWPAAAYNGFLHQAAMRAFVQLHAAAGDPNATLAARAAASDAACAAAMQKLLWVPQNGTAGGFWRAYQNAAGNAPNAPMSGTLHGQTWAAALGLGALAPRSQLATHVAAEVAAGCAYAAPPGLGWCGVGQLSFPSTGGWGQSASPSMSADNNAVDVWLRGAAALANSTTEAIVRLYSGLADLWNVHDLHVGPGGLGCGGSPQLSGAAVVGSPFVNAHYARHSQAWALQALLVGQRWHAPTRTLTLAPAPGALDLRADTAATAAAGSGPAVRAAASLPWFTPTAAGRLEAQPGPGGSGGAVWVRVLSGRLDAARVELRLPAVASSAGAACHWAGSLLASAQPGVVTVAAGQELLPAAFTWRVVCEEEEEEDRAVA